MRVNQRARLTEWLLLRGNKVKKYRTSFSLKQFTSINDFQNENLKSYAFHRFIPAYFHGEIRSGEITFSETKFPKHSPFSLPPLPAGFAESP